MLKTEASTMKMKGIKYFVGSIAQRIRVLRRKPGNGGIPLILAKDIISRERKAGLVLRYDSSLRVDASR